MRKLIATLPLLAAVAACELDFTGIGDAFAEGYLKGLCGGTTCSGQERRLTVEGRIRVGPYPVLLGEASVNLLLPESDTPFASERSIDGGYEFDFGVTAHSTVCDYRIQVVLRDGRRSEPTPLFPSRPDPCAVQSYQGPLIELDAYAPLDEPYVLTGTVFVDGRLATVGEARVQMNVRETAVPGPLPQVYTDEDGAFAFETTDQGQWYHFCVERASATARLADGREQLTFLGGLRLSSGRDDFLAPVWDLSDPRCSGGQQLPDVRFGQRRAASGFVSVGTYPRSDRVGAGEASVELLDPADSTVVGEAYPTAADGSFTVWFPYGLANPGCDWLLRATLADGASEVRPLVLPDDSTCVEDFYHLFEFEASVRIDGTELELDEAREIALPRTVRDPNQHVG